MEFGIATECGFGRRDPATIPVDPRYVPIKYIQGVERIRYIEFFDGWFQQLKVRGTAETTNAGEPCYVYQVRDGRRLDVDSQMVLGVFQVVETFRAPIVLDGQELP